MSSVIASQVLANGLRTEFADTYSTIQNRLADSRLAQVMDLSLGATNRQHEFAYFEAAPHMEYWRRGDTIPTDAFDAKQWTVPVYTWARRVPWHKEDRKDDQTSSLMEVARMAGQSAALLPERFFFDLITNSTNTLPAVPNAPDGASMYSTTDGSSDPRFETTNGNLLTGAGLASTANIRQDYYNAIEQFKLFKDGKGQPLLSDDVTDGGVIIIHPAGQTEAFEEAFLQRRQGMVMGSDAGTTPTNLIQDASRDVTLWGTQRLSDANDWYVFLRRAPKLPTFMLDREGLQEFEALEGGNNSDHVRDTGYEYVQWERRAGAGIALPYATIKVSNA